MALVCCCCVVVTFTCDLVVVGDLLLLLVCLRCCYFVVPLPTPLIVRCHVVVDRCCSGTGLVVVITLVVTTVVIAACIYVVVTCVGCTLPAFICSPLTLLQLHCCICSVVGLVVVDFVERYVPLHLVTLIVQ